MGGADANAVVSHASEVLLKLSGNPEVELMDTNMSITGPLQTTNPGNVAARPALRSPAGPRVAACGVHGSSCACDDIIASVYSDQTALTGPRMTATSPLAGASSPCTG